MHGCGRAGVGAGRDRAGQEEEILIISKSVHVQLSQFVHDSLALLQTSLATCTFLKNKKMVPAFSLLSSETFISYKEAKGLRKPSTSKTNRLVSMTDLRKFFGLGLGRAGISVLFVQIETSQLIRNMLKVTEGILTR